MRKGSVLPGAGRPIAPTYSSLKSVQHGLTPGSIATRFSRGERRHRGVGARHSILPTTPAILRIPISDERGSTAIIRPADDGDDGNGERTARTTAMVTTTVTDLL